MFWYLIPDGHAHSQCRAESPQSGSVGEVVATWVGRAGCRSSLLGTKLHSSDHLLEVIPAMKVWAVQARLAIHVVAMPGVRIGLQISESIIAQEHYRESAFYRYTNRATLATNMCKNRRKLVLLGLG